MPPVRDGPVRVLFESVHELHHRAGWPSLRAIAKEVGCSHTTISGAFSEPRVPRWGLLELVVEALGGDPDGFHPLWLAASQAERNGTATRPESTVDVVGATGTVPRQLPADVAGFTGRGHDLADLDRILGTAGPAVVIAAISGTAGVGKTALAVRWAHRVAERFPDGQLYVNLRGYDPETPIEPAEVLAAFLRDLGVADRDIPPALSQRAARYRTLLAGRRVLVLLDNARSVDQVRDLLPGSPSCFILVTSRDSLPALVARHGAVRVNLDLLSPGEAVTLLRTLVGARVDAEPDAAAALAERCARLPLALRIAAELAVSRPSATLTDLVLELGDERGRLDALAAGGDDHTAVRAVFSWSQRQLAPDARRAFHLLGLHPGQDVDAPAVAALVDTGLAGGRRLLDALCRAHLVEETGPGRYGMHDLLRAYARELAGEYDEATRREARGRLFDHYLRAAEEAAGASTPAARAWFDAERANLVDVAAAAVPDWPAHAAGLAAALAPYLDAGAHYRQALSVHGFALGAARAHGDRAAEGVALGLLGTVHRRLGDYRGAQEHYERALAVHRDLGDRAGEGRALHGLGILDWRAGRYREALDHLDGALRRYREVGDRAGEGSALYNLAIVYRRLGRHQEALANYGRALVIHRDIGDRGGEGRTLGNLGVVELRLGHYQEALSHHQLSLAIHRELGDPTGESVVLTNLGAAYERLERYPEALDHYRRAYAICERVGYRVGQGDALRGIGVVHHRVGRHHEALDHLQRAIGIAREIGEADLETGAHNDLGETLRVAGRPGEARVHYESALALAGRTGDRYELARALDGLAHLRRAGGDADGAAELWDRAVAIYAELGVPEATAERPR